MNDKQSKRIWYRKRKEFPLLVQIPAKIESKWMNPFSNLPNRLISKKKSFICVFSSLSHLTLVIDSLLWYFIFSCLFLGKFHSFYFILLAYCCHYQFQSLLHQRHKSNNDRIYYKGKSISVRQTLISDNKFAWIKI